MNRLLLGLFVLASVFAADELLAQAEATGLSKAEVQPQQRSAPDVAVLDRQQWTQLNDSINRGLEWLVSQQQEDGSFQTLDLGQPAITSFCLMAFLAQGESPINGKYQKQLSKAVDYIANQQKPNGLIATLAPRAVPIPRVFRNQSTGWPAVYNHAISGIALSEVYGQCAPEQAEKLMPVIEKAIAATIEMQAWPGKKEHEVGGWRYLYVRDGGVDADLSITGWQLMFLRSARNAGFDPPEEAIEAAVNYVEGCFVKRQNRQVHSYFGKGHCCSRAMAGAGILALAHAGKHDSKEATASGEWILKHDFSNYNDDTPPYRTATHRDRYHYGAFLCSQAMFQLGGKYWKQFFPTLVDELIGNQRPSGSWPAERRDSEYGSCYTTSLSILSLSVPNQMLPIFQR